LQNLPEITQQLFQQCGNGENPSLWKLHKLALKCLESQDKTVIQKGKDILLKILEISPNDKTALYNLACAESLLENVNEALSALEKAINAGYNDLSHLLNDKDFNNIKNSDGFRYLIENLESSLFPESSIKPQENTTEKEEIDPLEEKINSLEQIFQLPRDILRELLIQEKGNLEEVITKLCN